MQLLHVCRGHNRTCNLQVKENEKKNCKNDLFSLPIYLLYEHIIRYHDLAMNGQINGLRGHVRSMPLLRIISGKPIHLVDRW